MPSKHWKEAAEYAEDMARYDVPWLWWEYKPPSNKEYVRCHCHPQRNEHAEYRRRPRTIRIGEYDVPAPMREAPEYRSIYYTPNMDEKELFLESTWDEHIVDKRRLANGFCHLTAEAAELHAKALLSFTQRG